MNVRISLDPVEKITRMGNVTGFEPAGDTPAREEPVRPGCFTPKETDSRGLRETPKAQRKAEALRRAVAHVTTPAGKKPVLKTMMTTACERDCFYCPFRAGRTRTERITFQPDEMAKGFDRIQRAGMVDGLFLSSGIINGGPSAQDKIIETADILRRTYHYQGYIHLKIMPGAEYEQIRKAMQLADRISINLEGSTQERLKRLAPKKEFWNELVQRLLWAEQIRRNDHVRASSVTQFVVGAVGDTDLELLTMSERLYRQAGIRRAYFSTFHPIEQTPFEELPPASNKRGYRLYQASFLLRDYGWNVEDIDFQDDQNLRLDVDPKRAWADRHLRQEPVEVNRADRELLLRVPGIGPVSADRILVARRHNVVTEMTQLRKLGIPKPEKAAPYVLLNGRQPGYQMELL